MADVEMYSKIWCPYCSRAKSLLQSKGVAFRDNDVTSDMLREQEMVARSGRRTVPQVFIDGRSVGGYDDLTVLDASGELDRLLGLAA
jgi:glutaredoxin 3